MTDYLFFVLLGSAAAAIIGAFGIGLMITHQSSGVVNFGFGAMATWSGYVYADLRQGAYPFPIPGLPARYHFDGDIGFRWAMLLTLATAAVIGWFVYTLVFRPLFRAPALAKIVASIGLVIVFISLVENRFPDNAGLRVDPILPREPVTVMNDVTVPRDGLWLLVVVVAIAATVWATMRFTRAGLVTRAAAENEKGVVLLGYSPTLAASATFVVASVIGAFVVVLASPMIQLSSTNFTFGFLIPALGAALIGRFRRVWPTVLTGIAIGLVQSTFTKLQGDVSWFPQYGAREGLPFVVIIVAMVALGERVPDRGAVDTWKLPAVPAARVTPQSVLIPVGLAVVGLLALGPLWRGAIMT
ncbi:MAG: branched-chain amino acid ABC transporter permease, partial [Ilumatobacter sp.]